VPGEPPVKQRVLVIDDEIHMCESLCEILESEGLEALHSTDPVEALGTLSDKSVDLVFLDIKMPEMSGIDLLKYMKAVAPAVPVIIITGYPSVDNIVQSKIGRAHV
jgi:DNA-binding NtrC family response regulator